MINSDPAPVNSDRGALRSFYHHVRATSRQLCAPLSDADASAQSMPDASPAKWHLAHSSWFFEAMVLGPHVPTYLPYDSRFNFLFNSYYESVGRRHPRARRGMLTRPSLDEILAYRAYVDSAMDALFDRPSPPAITDLIELGCHHEQQHQELLLTDLLHLFAQNPLRPAYKDPAPAAIEPTDGATARFVDFAGGLVEIGHAGRDFAFDCEGPRHKIWLEPFRLADRPVTNGEYLAFIQDGGYRNPLLWLSEGWARTQELDWRHPLYWEQQDGVWGAMTLRGFERIDPAAPVAHVSYFEADAFASWAGHRLPTEQEWEYAATDVALTGNFADSGRLRPRPAPVAPPSAAAPPRQMFGDVWEWTRSAYAPYPRFRPAPGAVGEYNGKFMSGQFVLRGGSCVTPAGHMRASYRNFFPPDARWQFSGLRLAEDL